MHIIDKTEQLQYYDKWFQIYTHSFQKINPLGHEESFLDRLNELIPNVPFEEYHLGLISNDVVQMRALVNAYKQIKELSKT
ncbi:hypothetical protein [Brevibacillus sp. NRS-1366]|uniref:hypothetical protein n=1 Tax=Brevibacillus sp. NRS-1366 TaxID=3233899 RepID=UPI003D251D6F